MESIGRPREVASGGYLWRMTPSLDHRGAARILDIAESRGSRSAALVGFAVILLLAAHAAARGGFPSSAQAAAMSSAGAYPALAAQAGESAHMKQLMAAVLVASVGVGHARAENAIQWRVQDGGNGHWYGWGQVAISDATFQQVREAAVIRGGHLPTISNAAENAWVHANIGGGLGLFHLPGGVWQNVTGEPVTYFNWAPGQPSSLDQPVFAAYWSGTSNTWADITDAEVGNPADPNTGFRIEWDADCNNDGIVDYGQILDGSLTDGNVNNIPDCCEGGEACVPRFAQWRISDGGNGHWYMLNWEVREWPAAQTRAVQLGGHLATITTNAERLFVLPLCDNHIGADVWLGASRANAASPVQWVTGEPWSYAAWGPGSPNPNSPNDYLEMIGRSNEADFGLWNLELIYAWGPGQISLIEFDADCNSDGIVDFGQIRDGSLADANANNIPDCCEVGTACDCPGDTNRDGAIDGIDLATVLTRWAQSAAKFPDADCNRDGVIDGSDLAIVLAGWGGCP